MVPNGFDALLSFAIGWVETDVTVVVTLLGTAMLIGTIGFMVFLAVAPYVSPKWEDEFAVSAATDDRQTGSSGTGAGSD